MEISLENVATDYYLYGFEYVTVVFCEFHDITGQNVTAFLNCRRMTHWKDITL